MPHNLDHENYPILDNIGKGTLNTKSESFLMSDKAKDLKRKEIGYMILVLI